MTPFLSLLLLLLHPLRVAAFSPNSLARPWYGDDSFGPNGGDGSGSYLRRRGRRRRRRRRSALEEREDDDDDEGGRGKEGGCAPEWLGQQQGPYGRNRLHLRRDGRHSRPYSGDHVLFLSSSGNNNNNSDGSGSLGPSENNDHDDDHHQENYEKDLLGNMDDSGGGFATPSSPQPPSPVATPTTLGDSGTTSSTIAAMTTVLHSSTGNLSNTRRVNGAVYEEAPNVRNSFKQLWPLTRPSSFPGVVCLHMLGPYLALQQLAQKQSAVLSPRFYWTTMANPVMFLTLAALLLTSATSMVINDYFDAKLGRDEDRHRPLADGRVPLYVARSFLNYLYGGAMLTLAFLPGIPTRVSVVVGLLLTYWYTKHLKPVTWLKNIVCAALIAASPMTSASAAVHLVSPSSYNPAILTVTNLWRLVGFMFFGIMSREIMMDCNDSKSDEHAGVFTVPVVYGRRFASRVAFGFVLIATALASSGTLRQFSSFATSKTTKASASLLGVAISAPVRRSVLVTAGSLILLRRAWQVMMCEGSDRNVVDTAVNESLISVLLVWASFV